MLNHHTKLNPTTPAGAPTRAVATAAVTAAALLTGFAALQFALAGGAPVGEHVWGGRSTTAVLSPTLRIVSALAAAVLIWMAGVILARADLVAINPVPPRWLARTVWIIAGYMTLNTLGNLASTSTVEQLVFGPVTATIAATAAVVAHHGRRS